MGKGKGSGVPKWMEGVAKEAVGIGREYADIGKQFAGLATPYLRQTGDYWSALLSGDKQQMQKFVAPTASAVGAQYDSAIRNIETFLPRGGERNLAVAQTGAAKAGDIAKLYTAVQPQAASALAQLAGVGISGTGTGGGVGQGFFGTGTSGGASLLNYYGQQQQALGTGLGGLAQGAGTLVGLKKAAKVGAAGGCWLAFATFGSHDHRAWRFRFWMGNRAPFVVRLAYTTLAPTLARLVRAWTPAWRISYNGLSWVEARL